MDVGNFFASVERALFELATWVILIPKTLYRVLTRPEAIPEYVRRELSEGKAEQFGGTLSPVFLYLFLALGPFLFMQLVDIPRAPIEGEQSGVVDTSYSFSVGLQNSYPEQTRVEWAVYRGASELDRVESCYETLGGAVVDADGEPGQARRIACIEQLFRVLLEGRGYAIEDARDSVAAIYGDTSADEFAEYWCSPPPYVGCEGHEEWKLFLELAEDPVHGVDVAWDSVAAWYGDETAIDITLYWCAPPAGAGCEGSAVGRVWAHFLELVDVKNVAVDDAVAAMVTGRFSRQESLVRAIGDYWCSPPPGKGCVYPEATQPEQVVYVPVADESASVADQQDEEYESPFDAFVDLVTEEEYGVDEAVVALEDAYASELVLEVAVLWCAPPADAGCESSAVGEAWTEFLLFVQEQGSSAEEARARIGGGYGEDIAGGIIEFWCSPPPGIGCEETDELGTETEFSEAPFEVAGAVQCIGASDAFFFGESVARDSLLCAWKQADTYSIRAMVYDARNAKLVDVSGDHSIAITAIPAAADEQPKKREQRDAGGAAASTPGLSDMVRDPDTMLMALALLAFPLTLALLTVLFHAPELTQAAIKPAFYIQCLYLSPFALAVWIPGLLDNYWPEPDGPEAAVWAGLLILALLVWLLAVEVNFIASERGTSKLKAFAILLTPVLLLLVLVFVAFFASTEFSKFEAVEHAAYVLIVLLAVPLLVRYVGTVFRGLFGRRRRGAA